MIWISIGVITVLGFFINQRMQLIKKEKAPFFRMRKFFLDDLDRERFSGNWKRRQKINARILWLNAIKEEYKGIFSRSGEQNKMDRYLMALSENDIIYPNKWSLNEEKHIAYARIIISEWGKTLEAQMKESPIIYKLESVLPVPKKLILKASFYLIDAYNANPARRNKIFRELIQVADESMIYLDFFIDIEINLPKDSNELRKEELINFSEALKKYKNENPSIIEDNLDFIDWRSGKKWLQETATYATNNDINRAKICLDRAKKSNIPTEDILAFSSLIERFASRGLDKKRKYLKEKEEKIIDSVSLFLLCK
ncbi:MAG: hypothetical protein EOL97_14920 [Spirochaetia bacterium]|nr:hypothetical protein [Spirochaetia bacterium]